MNRFASGQTGCTPKSRRLLAIMRRSFDQSVRSKSTRAFPTVSLQDFPEFGDGAGYPAPGFVPVALSGQPRYKIEHLP
jgi:hypothetical protein